MITPILDLMEQRVATRRERWETLEVPTLPWPQDMNEATIVSRYSRVGMSTRRRFLRSSVLVPIAEWHETPSALARDYIMLKYSKRPMWTSAQRDRILQELAPVGFLSEPDTYMGQPLYVSPRNFREGAYIDLKAAYWSIMVRFGWAIDYFPGEWLARDDPPLDFPFQDSKRTRNSLVSVGASTKMTMWHPDKGFTKEARPNPRANAQLYCLVMDVLHSMAQDAIACGACYVFADGYIAPDAKSIYSVCQMIRDWGFDFTLKGRGDGWVSNMGSYRVGGRRTKFRHENSEHKEIKDVTYRRWLQGRMAWGRSACGWHDSFVHNLKAA